MRHATTSALLAALLLVAFAGPSARAADDSVKARLEAVDFKFTVDEDGDYKLTYNFTEDKRTQLIFVSGISEEVGGLRVRRIFSPAAHVGRDSITGEKALALLADTSTFKIGGWEVAGDILYFAADVPDSVDAKTLEALMNVVASIADDKEIQLTGKDEF